jgi:hypothetical protein
VAARPAVALVGSYELLIIVIRGSQVPADGTPGSGRDADPVHHTNETTTTTTTTVAALPAFRRHIAPGPSTR